jgi:hypothetical protein
MNRLKNNTGIISYFLIILLGLSGCQDDNLKRTKIYPDIPKYFIGYFNDFPVFNVANKGELIFLNQDKAYTYFKYDTTFIPKFVKDSIVIFSKGSELVFLRLGEQQRCFKTNSSIINVGYSSLDSSIYFSNNYKQEIKTLDFRNGQISILKAKGHYLTTIGNFLYFYKYSNENEVNPIVDLYKVELKENRIPVKIAEKVLEEFLVISNDGLYLLTDSSREGFGTYIFCLNNHTYSKVEVNIPESFPFAYNGKNQNQFIFYNIYTLDKKSIDIECIKALNSK